MLLLLLLRWLLLLLLLRERRKAGHRTVTSEMCKRRWWLRGERLGLHRTRLGVGRVLLGGKGRERFNHTGLRLRRLRKVWRWRRRLVVLLLLWCRCALLENGK